MFDVELNATCPFCCAKPGDPCTGNHPGPICHTGRVPKLRAQLGLIFAELVELKKRVEELESDRGRFGEPR